MRILALDTSTMNSTVTIMEDGKIIADYSLNQEKTHSESLVPMIDQVLQGLNLSIRDIDLIAPSIGPGSFTGLRIGLTVAKTLAQFTEMKIVGISTLEALARGVKSDDLIIPLIDARGKRVFAGGYLGGEKYFEEGLFDIDKLLENLSGKLEELKKDNRDLKLIFLGEASEIHREKLEKHGLVMDANFNYCIGNNLAVIAREKAIRGEFDNLYSLSPNYLRKSQAEIDYAKKH